MNLKITSSELNKVSSIFIFFFIDEETKEWKNFKAFSKIIHLGRNPSNFESIYVGLEGSY